MRGVIAIFLILGFLIPGFGKGKEKFKARKNSYYAYADKYKKRDREQETDFHIMKVPFKVNKDAPADRVKLEEMVKELF